MSRGLAARQIGDQFVDHDGAKWELSSLLHFPEEQTEVTHTDLNSLNQDIETFKRKNNIDDLTVLNHPNQGTKAAVFFSVTNEKNEEKNYLRYFKKLNRSGLAFSWGGRALRESTGLSVDTGGSQSEHIPIKPSEIISSDVYLKPDEVIDLIDSKVELPDDFRNGTVEMLSSLQKNQMPFVKGLAKYRSAVEKYVGEYAAPMYILKNQERLSEEYDVIQKDVDYSKIFFPIAGNWPLVDSFVGDTTERNSFGISSKGGGSGAAASLKTISDIYEFDIDVNHPIRKEAEYVIDSLNCITNNSMIEGPLKAATRMGLISSDDSDFVTYQVERCSRDPDGLIPDSIMKMMENIKPNLEHDNYCVGYHMLSGVAREVCAQLNTDPMLDKVFRVALKQKDFVQVYAKTQKCKDMLRFSDFSILDPANFDGKVKMCAQKPYMATTMPKGKITFKIQR